MGMLDLIDAARGYVEAEVVWDVSFWSSFREGGEDSEKSLSGTDGLECVPFMTGVEAGLVEEGDMFKVSRNVLDQSIRILYTSREAGYGNCSLLTWKVSPPILTVLVAIYVYTND